MLHLTAPFPPADGQRAAGVLIFGAGLIGSRIGASLARRGWVFAPTASPTPWQDDAALVGHLAEVERRVLDPVASRLDIIWSAGRAGFAADEAQTRGEEQNFLRLLDLVSRLLRRSDADLVFHLISSAGGLFEGQRHVDAESQPEPQRAYGALKLRLEEHLSSFEAARSLARHVYRLASVYGPAPRGGRRGLVPTLLYNAREGRATPIVGQLTTLRDYVYTEDIARRLADACTGPAGEDRCEILASGKPTTIHEIVHHVRRVVHRVPALVFAARRDNSTDITFAPSALPPDWSTTDLETAIYQLHRQVFDSGMARRVRA